jgi:hypothetical protein
MEFDYLRKRMPSDFTRAAKKWEVLKEMLAPKTGLVDLDYYESDESDDLENSDVSWAFSEGDDFFNNARWGWKPVVEAKLRSHINRLGEVLLGPVYTCEGYEWPHGEDGYPCMPIAQIDLRNASKICKENLGDGLLQLFEKLDGSSSDYFVRKIPRKYISKQKLTSIPDWGEALIEKQPFADCWMVDQGRICMQIMGFSERAFTVSHSFEFDVEVQKGHKEFSLFNRRKEALQKAVDELEEKYSAHGTHLFGTFPGGQYELDGQYEQDPSFHPLLSLNGYPPCKKSRLIKAGFDFGSGLEFYQLGNGQLIIKNQSHRVPKFYFRYFN